MAMNQKLGLQARLSQRLVLTPSLQQAIKLLPLTTLELADALEQEVMENPLLEEAPPADASGPDEPVAEEAATTEEKHDAIDEIDVDKFFEDYIEDSYESRPMPSSDVPEAPPIENTLVEAPDLYDHLLWQLRMTTTDELTQEIGVAIIENLDEDGLLRASIEEIANLGPYAHADVETALRVVQALDPPGIAGRDLQECLRLQLKRLGLEGSVTDIIIRDHLKQLQSHQYGEIARALSLSADVVSQHLEVIRDLDPKPGAKLSPSRSTYVVPDVYIVKEGDDYKTVLNDDSLPRLRISPTYKRMLDNKEPGSEATREYVKDKLRSALWLLKSVDQRQRTIFKVSESIVRHQKAFLDHGLEHLRPLVLRDVANDIGMHESTVSRVVANKYMHTPRGVYELRFFFHSGIASSVGDSVSSVTIKDKIRKMIDAEDALHPLSDSRIAELLNQEGLKLARRTVAKYREEIRIPPSNLRRSAT